MKKRLNFTKNYGRVHQILNENKVVQPPQITGAITVQIDTKPALHTNYSDLIFLTGHYHAAVIKYKQKDFKKSWEYFNEFFSKIKPLCEEILSKENYHNLESKKVFEIVSYQDAMPLKIMKNCFQQSTDIFLAIYGKDHPFVKDYVLVNNNECH